MQDIIPFFLCEMGICASPHGPDEISIVQSMFQDM
jgi:hypothetical protein